MMGTASSAAKADGRRSLQFGICALPPHGLVAGPCLCVASPHRQEWYDPGSAPISYERPTGALTRRRPIILVTPLAESQTCDESNRYQDYKRNVHTLSPDHDAVVCAACNAVHDWQLGNLGFRNARLSLL